MDYKEKYEQAVKRAKAMIKVANNQEETYNSVITIFPELKESDGEKMRKWLIDYLNNRVLNSPCGAEKEAVSKSIAWLEKQRNKDEEILVLKDQIESLHAAIKATKNIHKIELEKLGFTTDKVEPKFKVGDWIVSDCSNVAYIESISDTKYNLQCIDRYHEKMSVEYVDRCWHLWTIQDAKDGDVLVFKNNIGGIIICKSPTDYDTRSYCRLVSNSFVGKEEGGWDSTLLHPATKEQRDTLFKAMANAGYTFDFDKKELNKIENKSTAWSEEDERMYRVLHNLIYSTPYCDSRKELSAWLKSLKNKAQLKQKQELDKEDEKCIRLSTDIIDSALHAGFCVQLDRDRCVDWLNSLKDRIQPKFEWNEEDKDILNTIINHFEIDLECTENDDIIRWLKSLRPQSQWKPSNEQMEALESALYTNMSRNDERYSVLSEFVAELKKLKKE